MSAPPQIRAPLTLEVDESDLDASRSDTLSKSDYTSQEEEQECFEDDECVQLSPMHAAPLRVTPFAHLSTNDDDYDNEEVDSKEETHEASTFTNLLPVSQSLLANDFAFSSGSDVELDVDEHGLDQVHGTRVYYDEYSNAPDSDVMSEHSQDNFSDNEGYSGVPRVVLSSELVEADTTMQGTSIVVGDTGLLKSSVEDNSNSQVQCITCEPESAENVEHSTATQTTKANGSGGVAHDQFKECENLVSITRSSSVVDSNAELRNSSAGFESNHDAYESNIIHTHESCELLDPTLLQECHVEKDLSETILGVSLEDELLCAYHSVEHVETLDVECTAKDEATVELNTATQESDTEGSASDGDVEGLMSLAVEQFREQISALSILLSSKGSGKDSQEKQAIRSSHGSMNLPMDDAKGEFIYAEADGSSGTATSADESSVIFLEDPSLSYFDARADFQGNITESEKGKIQNIQAISVKFLRLVQRINLSLEDSLVSKVLCRLVADIERRSNQEFVIKSAKTSAKKLEENCQDDLDFSLNILLLGSSGVGKSATINSIFGDMKVVINAFEPATTSVKEVSGTIDGIKIRILDTPGLKSCIKEQSYNKKILSSIKRYMNKCPPDVILYVDRVDAQTRDLNDLPILSSITSSFGPSMWQHVILTLTHAASVPFDGPSGSPLGYEVFVAQKSYLVQQSITQAVRNMCQLSPSFMCPVALVENHPLCGKNLFGDCVLPNGHRWRSQLLALCFSLKILSEVSSVSGPQTLFDYWKHCFFQDRSQPLCHLFSLLLQSPAHLKFSANWN